MSYIFVDTDWTEYDIFSPSHWAAKDWSFLFRNEDDPYENSENNESSWINQELSWSDQIPQDSQEIQSNTWEKNNILWNIDYVWDMETSTWDAESELWKEQENSNLDPNNPFNLPEWAIEKTCIQRLWNSAMNHNKA